MIDLKTMKKSELYELAKKHNIKNKSTLNKKELIDALDKVLASKTSSKQIVLIQTDVDGR